MGKLILVPTPIGNLKDITLRAIEVLKSVDYILAEDTRQSGKLLKAHGIENKMVAFHQHNEHKKLDDIVAELNSGKELAAISDAGTPGISDPGFLLVRACIAEKIPVECLPGATAFVPALVASGLPSDQFVFEGFLPHKKGRATRIQKISNEERTVVLYESTHRLVKLMAQLSEAFEDERNVVVCRELTKLHEEIVRGTPEEIIQHFSHSTLKGEFVVIIAGKKD